MSTIAQQPREKLREILAKNGEALLQDPDRCEGLLKDHCGPHRREISALVGALEERVPLELKSSWQSAMTPEAMRARLVQRLEDNRGLAHDVADWAVDAWSYALGVGLDRNSDRLDSVVISGTPGVAGTGAQPAQAFGNAEFGNAQAGFAAQGGGHQASQPPVVPGPVVVPPAPSWSSGKKLGAGIAVLLLAAYGYSEKDKLLHVTPVDPCAQAQPGAAPVASKPGETNGGAPQGGSKADVATTSAKTCSDSGKASTDGQDQNPPPVEEVAQISIGAGTPLSVVVNEALSSTTAKEGQYVAATIQTPVMVDGKTAIPAGTKAVLQVVNVDQAGKLTGAAEIHLALVEMTVGGRRLTLHTNQASVKGQSKTVSTVKKTGALAAVGCAAGGLIGRISGHGGKGCAAGAAAGGTTGVVWSSKDKPKPAESAAGRVLKFKLTQPVDVA